MKVVLFCGGMGMRMRDYSDSVPKPMVPIGYRPILWHLMKYYSYYGHNDFILCLGYKADVIKDYFLNYNECLSNDFILTNGGKDIQLLNHDVQDWRITFVDTGLHANIGQRLMAVRKHLEGEEMFLANYADGLSDVPLSDYLEHFQRSGKLASFVCVKPGSSFHVVSADDDGVVNSISHISEGNFLINGGFFILKQEIFQYMKEGEELVVEPFQRLIDEKQLLAYRYDGFWGCMDTYKEREQLDNMHSRGEAPWEIWEALS